MVKRKLSSVYGIGRSLVQYYGKPWRFRTMDKFYARFLRPDDLCFDIGAHVGNRIRSWRALGARVVAVEPQPALFAVLRQIYGRSPHVQFLPVAIARTPGRIPLHLNLPNPTVTTASAHFIECASSTPSFSNERWQQVIEVPATTIDTLIAEYGLPRFVKIDVEGFEAEALAGLSEAVFAISVEFVPMAKEVARTALARLGGLGDYWFNASYGDTMRLLHSSPLCLSEIDDWLQRMAADGPAGDIFACLDPSPLMNDLE